MIYYSNPYGYYDHINNTTYNPNGNGQTNETNNNEPNSELGESVKEYYRTHGYM